METSGAAPLKASFLHPPRLHDKVCLVTGSSSGIGRAIALLFASHGAKLIVCADLSPQPRPGIETETQRTDALIIERCGTQSAIFVTCDVTKAQDMQAAVQQAVDIGGRLDVIVNCAGVGTANRYIRLHELEESEWEHVMRVNASGVFLGCKFALKQFLQQTPSPSGRRGWIVNIASILGVVGISGGAGAYCASKAAVVNLTKQIAIDYAKDRIHSNAVCPGFTRTAMTIPNQIDAAVNAEMIATTPWHEWATASDIAKAAVFLASDDASFVTGITLPVDGGFLAQ